MRYRTLVLPHYSYPSTKTLLAASMAPSQIIERTSNGIFVHLLEPKKMLCAQFKAYSTTLTGQCLQDDHDISKIPTSMEYNVEYMCING